MGLVGRGKQFWVICERPKTPIRDVLGPEPCLRELLIRYLVLTHECCQLLKLLAGSVIPKYRCRDFKIWLDGVGTICGFERPG